MTKTVSKKSRKKKLPHTYSKAQFEEVGAAIRAGVPLTPLQAAIFLQWSPGTLNVMRCLRAREEEKARAEKKEAELTAKHGPRFILIGTSPRYLFPDLRAYIEASKTQKRVSPDVGRPPKLAVAS